MRTRETDVSESVPQRHSAARLSNSQMSFRVVSVHHNYSVIEAVFEIVLKA